MHKQHQSRQVYLLVEDTFTPLLPGFLLKPRYTIRVPRYRYQASLKLLTTSCLTASSCSCRTSYKTLRIKRFSSSTKCTSSCLLFKLLQDRPTRLTPSRFCNFGPRESESQASSTRHVEWLHVLFKLQAQRDGPARLLPSCHHQVHSPLRHAAQAQA